MLCTSCLLVPSLDKVVPKYLKCVTSSILRPSMMTLALVLAIVLTGNGVNHGFWFLRADFHTISLCSLYWWDLAVRCWYNIDIISKTQVANGSSTNGCGDRGVFPAWSVPETSWIGWGIEGIPPRLTPTVVLKSSIIWLLRRTKLLDFS